MDDDSILGIFAATGAERPEDKIGYLLWRVAHRYQRDMDRAIASIELTHLQLVALIQTAWLGLVVSKPVTQLELGAFSNIHPMQLSLILKKLAAKKLITRPRCEDDSRAKLIVLTSAGIAALAAAMPRASAMQARFFGEDAESAVLKESLLGIVTKWHDDA